MSHTNHKKNLDRKYKPAPNWYSICTICGKLVELGQAFQACKTRRGTIWVHDVCLLNEQRELRAEKEAEA